MNASRLRTDVAYVELAAPLKAAGEVVATEGTVEGWTKAPVVVVVLVELVGVEATGIAPAGAVVEAKDVVGVVAARADVVGVVRTTGAADVTGLLETTDVLDRAEVALKTGASVTVFRYVVDDAEVGI